MDMDGWITIGTDIDSKEFEKDLKNLKKDSEKFAKEEEQLLSKKAKLEVDTSKSEKNIDDLNKKIDKTLQKLQKEKENLASISSWKQDSTEYSKQSEKLEKIQSSYDTLLTKHSNMLQMYELQKSNLNEINKKLVENATHQDDVNSKIEEMETKSLGLHLNFDNIGKSISDNIKKISKWAAAVFSLRTAYSAIRQAMSTISTYNDDMNNKLYSIKMMFASALEPIVTRLVNLVWKLMSYIAYIAKAWFGVDILAKSSANSMKAGAKAAKEMRKSVFGFDEANIQNDNGTTGVAGASTPKFEMPDNIEIPSWIKWIADNKDEVLGVVKQLVALIGTIKLAKLFLQLTQGGKSLKTIFDLLKGMSGLQIFVMIVGLVATLMGLYTTIEGIIAFIKNPSWGNFITILEGIALAIVGVTVAMVALNGANPISWIQKAIAIGSALTITFIELGKALFKDKANILSVKDAQEELKKAQDSLKQSTEELTSATKNYDDAVKNAEESSKKLAEAERKNKISGEELFNQVLDGKLKYQDMTTAQKEVYNAYTNNIDAQNKLKDSTEKLEESVNNYKNAKEEEKKASWENQLAIAKESDSYDDFRDSIVKAYEQGELSAEEARDYIERCCKDMDTAHSNTFTKNLPNDIKEGLEPTKYQSAWTKFKNAWNNFWGGLKTKLNMNVSSSFSSSGGGSGFAKGGIVYPKLQYCATGAIINQPGRGVPITQAVGGERGTEGILPLTDSQQMDLLGQSIARYMVINATIPVSINGRVFAREIKKVETQRDFATNG